LVKGIPALVITTDCEPADVINELKHIAPDAEKYLKDGSLVFIDAYTKSMGIEESDNPNIRYIDHPTDYAGIEKAFSEVVNQFKEKSPHFRTVVRSVSSLVALSDPTATYKFLQKLTGKNKHYKNVSMYLLDKGMHSEVEIQTLGHLMDSAIETKTDGVKTYLVVQGFGDVQSRAWIQYTYSKKGLNMGSFALDHLK
jgi:KaiC/GvpD/RAD55 family RecA-like ATPase